MSDAIWIALITATPPTLVGLAGVFVSLHNKRAIQEVHKSTNSRLDQLVKVTKSEAHAAGMKEQADKGKS